MSMSMDGRSRPFFDRLPKELPAEPFGWMTPNHCSIHKGVLYIVQTKYLVGDKVVNQFELLDSKNGKNFLPKAPSAKAIVFPEVVRFRKAPHGMEFSKITKKMLPPIPGDMYLLLDKEGTYIAMCESYTVNVDGLTVEWVGVIEGMKEPTHYWKIPVVGF